MNLEMISWNFSTYQEFLDYLYSLQDLKYQAFQSKLILEEIHMIGIRIPILHKIAKQISKGNYQSFFKYNRHYYYEEILLHGLVLGYIKVDFKDLLKELDVFLPYNTNWAINDTVCAKLKAFSNNREIGFEWILSLLESNDPWKIRFGFILLLDHYLIEDYIDDILKLSSKNYVNHYYVNMAISWLLSFCYIKFKDQTLSLLKSKKLSPWIQNKTISKIRDSLRISKEEKDYLKAFIK